VEKHLNTDCTICGTAGSGGRRGEGGTRDDFLAGDPEKRGRRNVGQFSGFGEKFPNPQRIEQEVISDKIDKRKRIDKPQGLFSMLMWSGG